MEGEQTPALICAQLRRMRTNARMNQEELGRRAAYSASTISAVETGTRPIDIPYARRMDEVLDTGGLFESLLQIAAREGQPSWFRPWLDAEREARQLRCFHATLIPALLQTENYARAVIRCDDLLSDDEVEKRVAARMDRQAILAQTNPPQLIVVIDEGILRRADESFRALMAQQIDHLIVSAERPQISVHVIPIHVGLHVGMSGPFALARGVDGGWVGSLETQLNGSVIDGESELATLMSRWETVRNEALPRRQSIDLLKEAVASWT